MLDAPAYSWLDNGPSGAYSFGDITENPMAIPKLSINSSDISGDAQFELADGKIITLKTFCIQDRLQRVSIGSLGIGDKFKTRDEQIFTIEDTSTTPGGNKLARSPRRVLWFYDSGSCANEDKNLEVVEILPLTLLERVDRQLAKVNLADLEEIIIARADFLAAYGELSGIHCRHAVRVKYNTEYPQGQFSLKFKSR
jgi:hypothetical protein